MVNSIQLADIPVDGLFLNAEAGFETTDFRSIVMQMKHLTILIKIKEMETYMKAKLFLRNYFIKQVL